MENLSDKDRAWLDYLRTAEGDGERARIEDHLAEYIVNQIGLEEFGHNMAMDDANYQAANKTFPDSIGAEEKRIFTEKFGDINALFFLLKIVGADFSLTRHGREYLQMVATRLKG